MHCALSLSACRVPWGNSGHERPLGQRRGLPHGDFYTCADRYSPGHLLPHKWESCMTVDRQSWGYRREMELADVLSPEELVANLVEVVALRRQPAAQRGPHVRRTHRARLRGAPAPDRLLARPQRRGHLRHAALALPERLAHAQRLVPLCLVPQFSIRCIHAISICCKFTNGGGNVQNTIAIT